MSNKRENDFCPTDKIDFCPPDEEIIGLKRRTGQEVAVALPTLNEERTIRKIIEGLLEKKRVGIIDELLVVDSGSRDQTPFICQSLQVPFYQAADYLRTKLNETPTFEESGRIGKGFNLWLSQFLTTAEILVFLDTDQENFNPEIANNLIYPLLKNPKLMLVKSLFQRESRLNNGEISSGGRVTQLTIKPLLAALYPEISDIQQPINGNVAVRRAVLESINFRSQYEPDLQIPLEAAFYFGRDAIEQVNCGIFTQEGQDLNALQRMAFQYTHALFEFFQQIGIININGKLNDVLIQFNERGETESYRYDSFKLPSALSFLEYQQNFSTNVYLSSDKNPPQTPQIVYMIDESNQLRNPSGSFTFPIDNNDQKIKLETLLKRLRLIHPGKNILLLAPPLLLQNWGLHPNNLLNFQVKRVSREEYQISSNIN